MPPSKTNTDLTTAQKTQLSDSIEEAGVALFDKNGTVRSPQDRAERAHSKGLCEGCAIKTHKVSKLKLLKSRTPLTNAHVYKGICIRCHGELVPVYIYRKWKEQNPMLVKPLKSPRSPNPRFSNASTISTQISNVSTTGASVGPQDSTPSSTPPGSQRGLGRNPSSCTNISSVEKTEDGKPTKKSISAPPFTTPGPDAKLKLEAQRDQDQDLPSDWKIVVEEEDDTNIIQKCSTTPPSSTPPTIPKLADKKDSSPATAASSSSIQLKVFQASPLAYEDYTGREIAIPFLDLETEETVLKEALEGSRIDVVFETATANSLGTFLSEGNPFLHFSCHGHRKYLFIEDGYGGGQQLLVDHNLKGWIRAGGQQLSFVFVSACHSRSAGEAFVDAGVTHVVCCEQNGQALSNTAALVFSRDFYRAVAHGKTLKQAFELAIHAVIHSPDLSRKNDIDPEEEAKKFALLPEEGVDHDISLFGATDTEKSSLMRRDQITAERKSSKRSMLPIPPQVFLGREVDMYRVLRALFVQKARLVRITGDPGIGKLSMGKALGHYMEKRTIWGPTFWLPLLSGKNTDDIDSHWSQLFSLIEDPDVPAFRFEANQAYRSASQEIFDHFYERKAVIVINAKPLVGEGIWKLCAFLDDMYERTKRTKVIVIHDDTNSPIQSKHGSGFPCCEVEHKLGPLNFDATASLFSRVCPLSTNPSQTRNVLYQKKPDRKVFKVLGNGNPTQTLQIARNMPQKEFNRLSELDDSLHISDFGCSLSFEKLPTDGLAPRPLGEGDSYRASEISMSSNSTDPDAEEVVEPSMGGESSSDRPPLRSQEEVFSRFAPLMRKEGIVHRKKVTAFIRKAAKGEKIRTTIDGKLETEYDVENDESWVVVGKAAGEHYVLTDEQFRTNYDTENPKEIAPSNEYKRLRHLGYKEYRSNRKVWARRVDELDMKFFRHGIEEDNPSAGAHFMAPWGSSMLVEQGDFLVIQYPEANTEIYRIEHSVFYDSYLDDEEEDEPKGVDFFTPQNVTIAVAVGAVVLVAALTFHRLSSTKR